ncbi:SusD-like starch-binding protein associating with outer membrane [Anseongella ginsenosidimutans]|uniref:SusD-like starch-binding protein associating with outer membrane n=1 Tax=Anseongella ginsenosidimutans TaxID=496056 RepID=A0A4R3KR15_9SPHI|nr:RagB/SusD family nutrient uptake outer membrane protein [Anseongella ginsenosidimutans]QEC52952.1 RagB/SusD family nutrient uptake outer membrane protein [Anseongella ginsenosidimutans]TCS87350.1 SusD-like starch-binding protein associating with outer membrane [Anseongella ginsenosidimutans]
MKAYIKHFIPVIASAMLVAGCGKDFLETEPTEFISAQQIKDATEKNPDIQAGSIAGLYSTMYTPGTGGTDLNHDDFGQKGWDIYMDLISSDMVLGGTVYGWYSSLARLQATTDYTRDECYMPWRYYYRIIFGANIVIDGLGGNDAALESDEARYYMGQAKAMRAYGYFYLANLYARSYDPSEPILPIYTDLEAPNQPKSTTQEVYDLIISDLTEAIELLDGFSRQSKSQINQSVAKGLLAYAYATTGQYDLAMQEAQDIVQSGNFPLMDEAAVTGGFNDINTAGWMWGVDITLDNGLDLVSWWGQVDIYTYSYAWVGDFKAIDKNLYDAIPDNDVRKAQFGNEDDYKLVPIGKFYDPGKTQGGQRNVTTDYVYMRVAEMYLLLAESAARSGNEQVARETLKDLLEERIPDASYVDALSGQALLDEIYLQTRIELWGEGKSYLAMKRNKATITRGPNHLSLAGQSFSFDDERLTLSIPQVEIQNNPQID